MLSALAASCRSGRAPIEIENRTFEDEATYVTTSLDVDLPAAKGAVATAIRAKLAEILYQDICHVSRVDDNPDFEAFAGDGVEGIGIARAALNPGKCKRREAAADETLGGKHPNRMIIAKDAGIRLCFFRRGEIDKYARNRAMEAAAEEGEYVWMAGDDAVRNEGANNAVELFRCVGPRKKMEFPISVCAGKPEDATDLFAARLGLAVEERPYPKRLLSRLLFHGAKYIR